MPIGLLLQEETESKGNHTFLWKNKTEQTPRIRLSIMLKPERALCHERLQDTGSNRGYKSRGSNPWMHELKETKKQKAVHGSNLHGQQSVHCPSKTMNSECRNQSVHRKLTLSTPANCLPRVSNIYSHRASGTRGRLGIGRSVHRPAYSVAWSLSYEYF